MKDNQYEEKGLELAQLMGDYVNSFSSDEKAEAFINGFKRQHRTLQQSAFRMMLKLMEHMATDEYRTDGRNVGSHETAKALLNGFKQTKLEECLSQGMKRDDAEKYVAQFVLPSQYLANV